MTDKMIYHIIHYYIFLFYYSVKILNSTDKLYSIILFIL